jgi:xanthine dehydrogenase accessory factor
MPALRTLGGWGQGDDASLLEQAATWLAAGHGVALATVAQTWGSAPRPQGSHMVIRDDGLFAGSVSGGCIEGAVLTEAEGVIASGAPKRLEFGVSNEQAWEVGLACGGRITILVQPVAPGGFAADLLSQVRTAMTSGDAVLCATPLNSGTTTIITPPDAEQPETLYRRYTPAMRLAIVGAVHITQALVPMAQALGYQPLVVDPRRAFAAPERFPGLLLSDAWPDEALEQWGITPATAVVTLTHDPKLDDPALEVALRSPAFYIAALGSRKTHASRLERLSAAGFDDATLARIHGPAGLSIGALSPAEIALSVLAQMTAVLRGSA